MNSLQLWISTIFSSLKLPPFTVSDFFEILILAWLVYKLLDWIKTTRAWTLLKGIITIVIAVGVIFLLNMDTLIYIIEHMLNVIIITIVVVFQPELRKVLENLGEKQLISSLLPLDSMNQVSQLFSDKTLNELVKASAEMAKVRTGAFSSRVLISLAIRKRPITMPIPKGRSRTRALKSPPRRLLSAPITAS